MKKLFLLVAIVSFTGLSNAQEKRKSNEISTQKVERKNNFDEWSKELNLSEAQQTQIRKINEDYKTKKQAIRKTGTASEFKKLNDQKKAEIDAILSPEQKVKKEQLHEQKALEKHKKAEMNLK